MTTEQSIDIKHVLNAVSKSKFGKYLNEEEIRGIIEDCEFKKFGEGNNLILSSYLAGAVYIIVKGKARIIDNTNDQFIS